MVYPKNRKLTLWYQIFFKKSGRLSVKKFVKNIDVTFYTRLDDKHPNKIKNIYTEMLKERLPYNY